ncbi:hypothetical protein U9M48_039650 [Paspalum notatum var. saurae]|uniref:DUF4283 domain-containing protein n=1 Tax=Paspalum notatum var. saurae TaxID=547442 RepID=A0AAQ3UK13_PASNO
MANNEGSFPSNNFGTPQNLQPQGFNPGFNPGFVDPGFGRGTGGYEGRGYQAPRGGRAWRGRGRGRGARGPSRQALGQDQTFFGAMANWNHQGAPVGFGPAGLAGGQALPALGQAGFGQGAGPVQAGPAGRAGARTVAGGQGLSGQHGGWFAAGRGGQQTAAQAHDGGPSQVVQEGISLGASSMIPSTVGMANDPTAILPSLGEHNVGADLQGDFGSFHGAIKGGKNKTSKPYCYRCFTKGHVISVFTTVLCCDMCDENDHATKACPYAKGAKPTATPCGYAVDGLGFYYIPFTGKQTETLDSKAALVKVSEGSLTVAQATVELERLLPGQHNWVLEIIDEKTFATTFPSEADLQRMILWGPVEAKSAKARMEISERKNVEEWKYEIPKTWIQFRGLSKELRDFPIIWAIGSIFGVTRNVDMKFTKKFGRSRLMVAVLNPDFVPEFVDVVIGDYVYELQFKVEKGGLDDPPTLINMDSQPEEDGNKDDEMKDAEKDNPVNDKTPNSTIENNLGNITKGPGGTRDNSTSAGGHSQSTFSLTPTGLEGTKAWVVNKFFSEPIVAPAVAPVTGSPMAAILAEEKTTPTRKSKRSAATADQDSLEKATRLKAKRNLEEPKEGGRTGFVGGLGCNALRREETQ